MNKEKVHLHKFIKIKTVGYDRLDPYINADIYKCEECRIYKIKVYDIYNSFGKDYKSQILTEIEMRKKAIKYGFSIV